MLDGMSDLSETGLTGAIPRLPLLSLFKPPISDITQVWSLSDGAGFSSFCSLNDAVELEFALGLC